MKARDYAYKAVQCSNNLYAELIIAFTEERFEARIAQLKVVLNKESRLKSKVHNLMGVAHYEEGRVDEAAELFMSSLDAK